MDEELSENKSTAIDSTAALAGTSLGLVIAGPAGALAGAAAAPLIARVGRGLLAHLSRRGEAVLAEAAEVAGGPGALEATFESRPDLAAMAVAAVSDAARSLFDDHVHAMGRVLRDAVSGAVVIGEAADLMAALTALNPDRVRVLKELRDRPLDEGHADHWDTDMVERMPMPRGRVRAALTGLELSGAVTANAAAMDGGERWTIEALGRSVLDYLGSDPASAESTDDD